MPRKARKYLETCYFHIMVQGINKSWIFSEDEDARKYISLLYKIKEDYKIKIITYCVMNNHCHIILNCENVDNMSLFMKRVNLNYAIYYNKKNNRVGYVFRDRYKSQAILSEKQLYNCIHYVYNNPVKAKICENPKDYPYLNYRENMYDINIIHEDNVDFIDIEDDDCYYQEMVNDYIRKNNFRINENKKDLCKLVKYLKDNKKMSYRKIEKVVGISRETLRNAYNNG